MVRRLPYDSECTEWLICHLFTRKTKVRKTTSGTLAGVAWVMVLKELRNNIKMMLHETTFNDDF